MKRKKRIKSNYLDLDYITPESLRAIASSMEKDGILCIHFDFDAGYNNVDITEYSTRLETNEEYNKRLKEEEDAKKEKERITSTKKKKTIIEARKLGLHISNVDPIPSNYDRVFWVMKDTIIENWTVPKDGYIWFDKNKKLGEQNIYDSAKKANAKRGE